MAALVSTCKRLGTSPARWMVVVAMCLAGFTVVAPASAATCTSTEMYIVAHEDDSLLFQSPDLLHAIQAGACVSTVYLTAGDAGDGQAYWSSRETGANAGYASMAGVPSTWTKGATNANGHSIVTYTLSGAPNVTELFLRLPDGNLSGSGFSTYGNESLQKLWTGRISSMHPVDGSASYTSQDLTDTLAALMTSLQPNNIRVQDYVGSFGDGDHSDHHASAYFARAAHQSYTAQHTFTGYQDYGTTDLPQNVFGADLTAKQNAYYAYARYDDTVCGSTTSCAGSDYAAWLERQYIAGSEGDPSANQAPTAVAGPDQTVGTGATVQLDGSGSSDPENDPLTYQWTQTSGPTVNLSSTTAAKPTFTAPSTATTLAFQLVVNDGKTNSTPSTVTITVASASAGSNAARIATASASSQDTSTGQTAAKAIDGVVDGYPGDYTKEWATVNGGAGSWLKLTWTDPVTLNKVVLHDRPNANDQITSATLAFDDGTKISAGTLPNDGAGLSLTVPDVTTRTLTLTVDGVSGTTENVGLAEIEAWAADTSGGGGNKAPTANAGTDQSVAPGTVVQLDGSASSDPDGDALTYKWTQTSGPTVDLQNATTAKPSFIAPADPATLGFQLVVNDGTVDSSPSSVTVTVTSTATNHAPTANAGPDQTVDQGTSVQLDGSGSSDPDGDPLTYQWTQTVGPAVNLSDPTAAKPTFTAPSTNTTLTFQLVVNDGQINSSPSTVTITVGSTAAGTNAARTATASASSQDTYYQQTAAKAIDGVVDGYPGDYTKEWATDGGGAGSWLKLTWTDATTLSKVVLYDRPNADDQITSATLAFDDGTKISVGTLPNNGSPLSVTVPNVTTRTLTLTIDGVSATTANIGLAEIEAWTSGTSGGGGTSNTAPTANAGPAQAVATGATVQLDGSGSSDADGDPLTYTWSQTAGPTVALSSTTAAKPTFTAPSTATSLTFQLVVNDGKADSSPSTVTVTVSGGTTNTAPTANAGPDQTVGAGATVQLDGSGSSDADGDPLTYQWTQTAGTAVTLSSATAAKPTFTAPSPTADTSLTFQLVVNDGKVASTADTVKITVHAALRGADVQTANGGAKIATLDSGDSITYTYNGQVALATLASGWDGTPLAVSLRLRDGGLLSLGGKADTVDILRSGSQVNLGTVNLKENYITAGNSATFNATMTASETTVNGAARTVVTIKVGTLAGGTGLRTAGGSSAMVWTPSGLAKDLYGSACSTTRVTETGTADREF